MAVREVTLSVPMEGADHNKRFVITRMSAFEADRWGRHCLQAALGCGADLTGITPEDGLAGLAAAGIGLFGAMEPERMDSLLERLMRCVSVQPDPANPSLRRPLHESDIEEIPTVGWLQKEAFGLHVDFFRGVGLLFSLPAPTGGEKDSPPPGASM
ncbi:MAG: hypothetical protein ABF593_11240 [Acetobacter papayae]|uniref:hypothetical protein n=1 Tax=Acetobacter papayae TaxID=1076592 RepID=UPI0039EA5262